jgi:hypothetical protein
MYRVFSEVFRDEESWQSVLLVVLKDGQNGG